ncbi:HTH domain-containing protein [Paenibacillus sp. OVF10]|nr:HTH domain-containing protein [Paenibacillus sp. OVF10]
MPISRHFEIVYMLLHRKTITAGELAQHFEVSTRTIYRDIDTLSAAGIPVYSSKGKGAGYHCSRVIPLTLHCCRARRKKMF